MTQNTNRIDLNIGHNLNEMFSERIFVLCIDNNIIFISPIYLCHIYIPFLSLYGQLYLFTYHNTFINAHPTLIIPDTITFAFVKLVVFTNQIVHACIARSGFEESTINGLTCPDMKA